MHSYLVQQRLKNIRRIILLFITGLIFSGVTAFPIETELQVAFHWIARQQWNNDLTNWIKTVYIGVSETNNKYAFIAYGTDWLAFAHLMIAVLFIGPLRDPVKNIWVIEFGMIACVSVFPLALIAGAFRGIPFFWQLFDCSFGVVGGILLWICYTKIKRLERGLVLQRQPVLI